MSQHESHDQQIPVAYPPPAEAPIGYPTLDANTQNVVDMPVTTKTRDDGFLAGCCAAICCCCVLDACF